MDAEKIKLSQSEFATLYMQNPDFDILNHDFFEKPIKSWLKEKSNVNSENVQDNIELEEKLKSYQRILRIYPKETVAKKLIDEGVYSSHQITGFSEEQFVYKFSPILGDVAQTKEIYRNAENVKQRTSLLFYNLRDMASPFYQATLTVNTRKELENRYAGIPGYTDLFGNMNNCDCPHDRSMLSPAAYFVDLMRLANQYITLSNQATIPAGYRLQERRPDLFEIPLDCEHTSNEVSCLQIVNDIIKCKVSKDLNTDALKYIANVLYPFNAPYNKPLKQIREYMKHLNVSLATIYSIYKSDDIHVSRELLGISLEQYKQLTHADCTESSLTNNYGRTITETDLGSLECAMTFATQTGLGTIENVEKLIFQHLSTIERASDVLRKQMFINRGTSNKCLNLKTKKNVVGDEFLYIENLDLSALDQMNRFIRLGHITGWNYADLDCVLQQTKSGNIDDEAITKIAQISTICKRYKIGIETAAGFFDDIKTTGIGTEKIPVDLFDQLFNFPSSFYGEGSTKTEEPYHPVYDRNPTYRSAILEWNPNENTHNNEGNSSSLSNIRSRLVGALSISDDELTLLSKKIMTLHGINNDQIPMSVPILTSFYRFSIQANLFGFSIAEFLDLLDLVGTKQVSQPNTFFKIERIVDWMKEARVTVGDFKFIINGTINKFIPLHTETELKILLQEVWKQAQSWVALPESFISNTFGQKASEEIVRQLLANRYINQWGVYEKGIEFSSCSDLIRLVRHSFVSDTIGDAASNIVYEQLTERKILQEGYLSKEITTDTDLSFLFIESENKDIKTEDVRTVLISIQELIGSISIRKADFISQKINEVQAEQAFDNLVAQGIVTRQSSLLISVTEDTDLSFLFVKEKEQRKMIAEVLSKLRKVSQNVELVSDICRNQKKAQADGVIECLASSFHSSTNTVGVSLEFASLITGINNPVLWLLKPCSEQQPLHADTVSLLHNLAQLLYLSSKLSLSDREMQSLIETPEAYETSINDGFRFTVELLGNLYLFKKIQAAFSDCGNGLISYFMAKDGKGAMEKMLAEITGWDQEQLAFLTYKYLPLKNTPRTIVEIQWLKDAFDLAAKFGTDVYFINKCASLSKLEANDENWDVYLSYSDAIFNVIYSKYKNNEWEAVYENLSAPVMESEREVWVNYMINQLSKFDPSIKSADDLYQLLLIDVSTSNDNHTSYIKEGIGAVQLYIQRCRMNLEAGIHKLNIKEQWWKWMANYRIWEANRKVFLYPENYLNPTLRHNKTPIYSELKDELMQGDITGERVTTVYMNYFDKLGKLSNLHISGTYLCEATDPKWGKCRNLWVFGRTTDVPYTYYYRRAINLSEEWHWEEWKKIDISIGSKYVTPLYAMNKLFVFWVETETIAGSTFENGNSKENKTVKASIKYSYYNFNEQWLQPQVLNNDMIIGYNPDQEYLPFILNYISDMNMKLNTDHLNWQKVYPISIPGHDDMPERIIVLFGNMPNLPNSKLGMPPAPANNKTSSQTAYNETLCQAIGRAVKATQEGIRGYAGLITGEILSSGMRESQSHVILMSDNSIFENPKSYKGYIDVKNGKLSVTDSKSIIWDNYLGDSLSLTGVTESTETCSLELISNVDTKNSSITMVKNMPEWFVFDNGDESFLVVPNDSNIKMINTILKVGSNLSSDSDEIDLFCGAYTSENPDIEKLNFRFYRLGTNVVQQLNYKLFAEGLHGLLSIESQQLKEYPFNRFYPQGVRPKQVTPPCTDQLDFDGSYSIYFWETFFYIPFSIADSLSDNLQFEEAQKWYHYLFNPTTGKEANSENPNDRYWGFLPFWGQVAEDMEKILTDSKQIAVYNNDPFNPDAIARMRITAFQKSIMMKYISNLVKWADHLFTQDTWEATIEATMLYVMAKNLLGEKPQSTGVCKSMETANFQKILDKYDKEIPQFLIQLENVVKLSKNTLSLVTKPYNDVDSYFCIPENEKFTEYWNTVADRLLKIRNSLDINGQKRKLSLFESPINPAALMKLLLSESNIGMRGMSTGKSPNITEYRFGSVINQAKNVASTLIQLGNSLLNALEKKDAEHLQLMRQMQEKVMLDMNMRIKEEQKKQAICNINALNENLKSAKYRLDHYSCLIESGLNPNEILHLQSTVLANTLSMSGSVMKMSSSLAHLIPNVGSPFAMTYGGMQIGASMDAVGAYFDLLSGYAGFVGNLSQTMAGYQRREEEWKLQKRAAEYDIANISCQLEASRIAQAIVQREIDVQKMQMEQNEEVETFYRSKFSNEELYSWMSNRLSSLYFQTYTLAFNLAKTAEKAYQYERGSNEHFIEYGYWDSLKKGLCSGETLQLALQQLENAYMNSGKRKLEIQKSISLLQYAPEEFMKLKSEGVCYFQLTEKMYNQDYPGHYCRQIKSISITIPAITGPYQQVKASLTQLGNRIILKPDINAVSYLLGDEQAIVPDDSIIRNNWKSNQQIALSSGVNDCGLFQLNFGDERFLPFEGTGAISSWKLEMDKATNTIDFESISDIIIQIKYEAISGDENFKAAVSKLKVVNSFMGYQLMSLKQYYSQEWHMFMHPTEQSAMQSIKISVNEQLFRRNLFGFKISDVSLMLELEDGVEYEGELQMNLCIGGQQLCYSFDTKCCISNRTIPDNMKEYMGIWTLTVDKKQIPVGLLNKIGYLDESKIKNIGILINYEGCLRLL